jgi:hypothetical protein
VLLPTKNEISSELPGCSLRLADQAPLLLGIVLAVARFDPGKPILGTHGIVDLPAEVVQSRLVAISLYWGGARSKSVQLRAILEVAVLFMGLFCMQPRSDPRRLRQPTWHQQRPAFGRLAVVERA